jgi:uncharacterized protein
MMYLNDSAETFDREAAARWFRKAAEQGLAEAQAALGLMYVHGQGVHIDKTQAYMWLTLACSCE